MSLLKKLTDQQTLELGDRGKQLLDDPAFNRAVAELAETYASAWRNSAPGDAETRELLYQKAQVLDDVVVALAGVVGAGKITADNLRRAKVRPIR
jgi:hypothetical protein